MMDSPDSVEGSLRIDTNLVERCEKAMQLSKQNDGKLSVSMGIREGCDENNVNIGNDKVMEMP